MDNKEIMLKIARVISAHGGIDHFMLTPLMLGDSGFELFYFIKDDK